MISTVSDAASRMPSVTSTFWIVPARSLIAYGRSPRSSTAPSGTMGAARVTLATRPSANRPPTRVFPALGIDATIFTCRVTGSAVGFTRVMCPVNDRVG